MISLINLGICVTNSIYFLLCQVTLNKVNLEFILDFILFCDNYTLISISFLYLHILHIYVFASIPFMLKSLKFKIFAFNFSSRFFWHFLNRLNLFKLNLLLWINMLESIKYWSFISTIENNCNFSDRRYDSFL